MTRSIIGTVVGMLLLIGLLMGAVSLLPAGRVSAQVVNLITGGVAGKSRTWAVPAYLKSCLYSSTTAGTNCHAGPMVLGCVVINTAGAASSTIKLYNQTGATVIAGTLGETIDATQVGRQFCYGRLLTGGLTVAITSSGASPDVSITWQGNP